MTETKQNLQKTRPFEKENQERRSYRRAGGIIAAFAVVILAVFFVIIYFSEHIYDDYTVKSEIDLANPGDSTILKKYSDGYLRCGTNGLAYFNKREIIWDDALSLTRPIVSVCGNYAAAADTKSYEVFIYDTSGRLSTVSSSYGVTALAVSELGTVAVSSCDGDANYVEMYDKSGSEILTIRTVFSSSGYLSDIALSDDGMKLAASFICVSEGSLNSKVLFYDFSVSDDTGEYMVGGFNQYDDIMVTNVMFMGNDTVCAVGDSGFSLYDFSGEPALKYEDLTFEWEIQTLIYNDSYIGFIVNDETSESNYVAKAYDTEGNPVMDSGFNFSYSRADFAGKHLLLYSSNDCRIYDFEGDEKGVCMFPEYISYISYTGRGANYILGTADSVKFIKLK